LRAIGDTPALPDVHLPDTRGLVYLGVGSLVETT
jgi:hypothetical protein